jgi:hypothetical protein
MARSSHRVYRLPVYLTPHELLVKEVGSCCHHGLENTSPRAKAGQAVVTTYWKNQRWPVGKLSDGAQAMLKSCLACVPTLGRYRRRNAAAYFIGA